MDEGYRDSIRARRELIVARMADALGRAGRSLDEVQLVAVSKTVGVDEVRAAIAAGYRVFGENRPQELVRKTAALAGDPDLPAVRFDMIGNLQTNKINAVLGRARRRIDAGELDAPADVLIEVNVSGEESKSGFAPAEVRAAMGELMELSGIRVRGLMTMAPRGDQDIARRTFRGLRELRDELERDHGVALPELSCGMSEDFEVALEEGSTIVRLGRVVFDPSFALQ